MHFLPNFSSLLMLIPRTILSLTTTSNYKLLLQEIQQIKSIFCETAWVVTEQKWFSLLQQLSSAVVCMDFHQEDIDLQFWN